MKKFVIITASVVIILVAAVFGAAYFVPRVIDWNDYKPRIASLVREATGRELKIDGDLRVLLIPNIELRAAGVHFSNTAGSKPADMVSVGSMDMKVRFWPLLRREVIVDALVLEKPAVFLQKDKAGQRNWVFQKGGESKGSGGGTGEDTEAAGLPFSELRLGDVRIEQGLFSYDDALTGQKVQATGMDVKVALEDLASPLSVSAGMTLNDKPVNVDILVDSIRRILSGQRGSVKTGLGSALVKVSYDGSVQLEPVPGLDGKFDLDIGSVGQLATWLGRPLGSQPDPGPLKMQARFTADGARVALQEALIEGRALKAKATGSFDGSGKQRKVVLNLESGVLNVDQYLPPRAPKPDAGPPPAQAASPRSRASKDILAGLPSTPLPLDLIRSTQADINVAVGGVKALQSLGFEVGRMNFTAKAQDGALVADLAADGLYGGNVKGNVKADAAGARLGLNADIAVTGLRVDRLAKLARNEDVTGGVISVTVNAIGSGSNPRALAESLKGELDFKLTGLRLKKAPGDALSEVKANVGLPGMDSKPKVKATVVYNKERVDMDVTVDPLRKILGGEKFKANVALSSNMVKLTYDGSVQQQPVPGLDGDLDLDIPSVGKLAAWVEQPLPPEQPDPGPLKLKAALAADGNKAELKQATLTGKAVSATASGSYDGGTKVPGIVANLDVTSMDLNAYLPKPKAEKKPVSKKESGKTRQAAAGWSEEPFDLGALSKVNADVDVKVASTRYRDLLIEQGRLTTKLAKGVLATKVDSLKLADGTIGADVKLDGAGKEALLTYQVSVLGVKARPLLQAFAGSGRLSGTTQLSAKGTGRGGNQKQFIESLNGEAQVKFLDGAIHGVNLAKTLRQARSLGLGDSEEQKTDFAELSGTFLIKNGIVSNDDLKMVAPLLRLGGKGNVPLPQRSVDYQLSATLVPSLEGQGSESQEALAGLPIPIRIEGPWDNVSYKIDWTSVFREAASDPKRLKEMPDNLRKAAQGFGVNLPIPGIPGVGGSETPSSSDPVSSILQSIPGVPKKPAGEEKSGEQSGATSILEQLQKLGVPQKEASSPSAPADATENQEKTEAPKVPNPVDALKGLFSR